MSQICSYCDQIFDFKEQLLDHLDVHSYTKMNKEIKNKEKLKKI